MLNIEVRKLLGKIVNCISAGEVLYHGATNTTSFSLSLFLFSCCFTFCLLYQAEASLSLSLTPIHTLSLTLSLSLSLSLTLTRTCNSILFYLFMSLLYQIQAVSPHPTDLAVYFSTKQTFRSLFQLVNCFWILVRPGCSLLLL